MWTQRAIAVSVVVFALSGCKAKQKDSQGEAKTQQGAVQAQSKPSRPQEVSPAETIPPDASEAQVRALRRYYENVWFVREAMQAAQPDKAIGESVSTIVEAGRPDWDHSHPSHEQIGGAEIAARLRAWVEALQTLEPSRRAATLLVADRTVVIEEEDGNLEPPALENLPIESKPPENRPKSEAQLQLEQIGTQFSYDAISERNRYALNWLRQAYELDPNGRVGELAFLLLMKMGFDTSPGCQNGEELFREVLRRGAEYLRQHRSTDVEARIHFMMGDGYRDIVALAAGQHGDTYAVADNYKLEAANALVKAIAEYRAGLLLGDKSYTSRIAQERLRSLQAGETPHDTSFYCQVLD